mmetsp:Transcript_54651/g.145967  ORF Transcript_54651/g.145967 Transcript_54651/m.145967 type:complete len:91 (+) Transcript_54651:402-674(+)
MDLFQICKEYLERRSAIRPRGDGSGGARHQWQLVGLFRRVAKCATAEMTECSPGLRAPARGSVSQYFEMKPFCWILRVCTGMRVDHFRVC